jgi:hypothetical protein
MTMEMPSELTQTRTTGVWAIRKHRRCPDGVGDQFTGQQLGRVSQFLQTPFERDSPDVTPRARHCRW